MFALIFLVRDISAIIRLLPLHSSS
jgi:hypothetical protein